MLASVKITSKRQITIPSKIFKKLGFKEGDVLAVDTSEDKLVLSKAQKGLEDLAGSVTLPQKYKGKSLDYIIQDAKREYFAKSHE